MLMEDIVVPDSATDYLCEGTDYLCELLSLRGLWGAEWGRQRTRQACYPWLEAPAEASPPLATARMRFAATP